MKSKKKILIVVIVFLVVLLVRKESGTETESGTILRNEPGKGTQEMVLEAAVDGESYKINVEVEERQYTKKEAKACIETAKKEIDKTFKGENKSLDHVNKPVDMRESYANGAVDADWSIDKEDIINANGEFVKTKLPKEGEVITAEVILSCGEVKEVDTFSFHAYSPVQSKEEQIAAVVQESEEKNRTKKRFVLPKKVGDMEITWAKEKSHTFLYLLIFGMIIAVLWRLRGVEEKRKRKRAREAELLMYYPQLVTTLSLLIGAGMSVTKAWERMALRYKEGKSGRKNEAYEEMWITWNEIQDGVGERKAYENFGKRCELSQYKKLSSMLSQNLRKGMAGMAEMLAKEAETALGQRRNLAKKLGEEAGTKLLLPMMIMLCVVMVIVIVPALLSF